MVHIAYINNNISHFRAKNIARNAYHLLPEQLQIPIRKVVQKARNRRFESYEE